MMREWLLGSNATVASKRINLAWGENTVVKVRCTGGSNSLTKMEKVWKMESRSMEHWLRDKRFGADIELHNSVIHFFNSKKSEFYAEEIDLLPKKWQKMLEVQRKYFDY
ncbi:hypothetical protein KIN20_014436 [Parelaphostrongylus tenuis]|uniref:Uncharacterized protein n=1 Tax=Parelaphostrongylus tenuis TaxID=148309 RepID=A0AAD5QRX1_PARTN|nr:hypothetical protein KIN20_014436 [Parelaphostrongylus tenuis]